MAEFTIKHRGESYIIEADDQTSAQAKLDDHFAKENKNESGLTKTFRSINETLGIPKNQALDPGTSFGGLVHGGEVLKGVPVIGQMVPDTPSIEKFETEHPILSELNKTAGGVASMIAPTAGVMNRISQGARVAPAIGRMGISTGGAPGIMPEIAGMSALGVGTNIADKFAEKGLETSKDDLTTAAILGVLQGATGPIVGKAVSPRFNPGRYTPEQLAAKFSEKELEQLLARRVPGAVEKTIENPLVSGMGGFGLSLLGGIHPIMGTAMGMAAPIIKKGWETNKIFHDPANRAILNALLLSKGSEVPGILLQE